MIEEEVPKKDFDLIIDTILKGEPIKGDPGIIDSMSSEQKLIFQYIKRAIKRLKANNK